MNASKALKSASMVLAESPAALQLRYLQTLATVATEKNSTIVFPLPINMLEGIGGITYDNHQKVPNRARSSCCLRPSLRHIFILWQPQQLEVLRISTLFKQSNFTAGSALAGKGIGQQRKKKKRAVCCFYF